MHLLPLQASTGRPIGYSRTKLAEPEELTADKLVLSWPGSGISADESLAPAQTSGTSTVKPSTPIAPKRPVASQGSFSRREVSQILTVSAGLRRVMASLSPETRQLLEKNPEIPALLSGIVPSLTVPAGPSSYDELMKLVDAFSVSTGQSIEIGEDPAHPGQAILVHNGAVEKVAPELVSDQPSQFRFDWSRWNDDTQSRLGTLHLGETSRQGQNLGPLAILDPALEARQSECSARVRDCQAILELGCGARAPGPTTPAKIGMISYVSSDYQLKRLEAVLREWKNNLEEFGHHHVSLRLCDDSPQPYGSKIKEMLLQMNESGPNSFLYLGAEEKSRLQQRVKSDLKGLISVEDASSVASLVAGAGPTQNRNLSLQLLGAEGGLQIDHDMTAEVLTKHFEQALPYDLLGALEQAPQDQLSSLRFCGAEDHAIDTILQAPLPEAKRSAWQVTENREPDKPSRVNSLDDPGMGGGLRAPMHVPKNFSQAARISPGLRDGDLALGNVAEAMAGQHPVELTQNILHRDTAGSRWGGASLLKEFLKFATVHHVFTGLPQTGMDAQTLSANLLERIKPDTSHLPEAQNLWFYPNSTNAVNGFMSERSAKLNELKALLAQAPYPSKLESWSGQKLSAQEKKQSAREIRMIIKKLKSESDEMRAQMHLDKHGRIDAQALTADLHQDVRKLIRCHALALAHAQQIATSLAQGADLNQ